MFSNCLKSNFNTEKVMNYGISILFRAIPLVMALFCFGYGIFVFHYGQDSGRLIAGPVVFSLGLICIALFATAATIIRQIIHTYNDFVRYALPLAGYTSAAIALGVGMFLIVASDIQAGFVAGHVICGVGLITACVATTATASTRFKLIPVNSKSQDPRIPDKAFTGRQGALLILMVFLISVAAWIWAFRLLARSEAETDSAYFVAGHVMAGLACICSSLIALVAAIVRQIRNTYTPIEQMWWHRYVLGVGTVSVIWGLIILANPNPANASTGYIMIGLGLVCYSISSKVILLAKIWKQDYPLASRIPLIPVVTALACLFLSAFLFELGTVHDYYFVPARVLAGLGAICFTLFSIVSILESGTSGKSVKKP